MNRIWVTVIAGFFAALPAPHLSANLNGSAGRRFDVLQRSDTIVRNAGAPRHSGVAALEAEISIGTTDGAAEYSFSDVADIAVASDGSIYVFDRGIPSLRKFDSNGRHVRSIGRQGQGPGEYTTGGGLAVLRDGRVILWDTGNWKINVYSAAGEFLEAWSTPSGASGSMSLITARSLVVDTAGIVHLNRPLFANRPAGGPPTNWIRFSPRGVAIDTLLPPVFSVAAKTITATSAAGNASSTAPVPFSANPLSAFSPLGYFVTAVPDRYAFELRVPAGGSARAPTPPAPWRAGEPVISIRKEGARGEAVSGRERDSARVATETLLKRTASNFTWNGAEIPRTKPFFQGLSVGQDGRIWVAIVRETTRRVGNISTRLGTAGAGAPPTPTPQGKPVPDLPALYDVFEPDGRYIGQVGVPPRVATVVKRGDHVWGVVYDEDDVPSVKRFRIVWK